MNKQRLNFTVAALLLSTLLSGCAARHTPSDAIKAKVESSIGKRFAETDHSRATGAVTRVIRDDGKVREFEYQWKNGCAYALLVDVSTDLILSWRYTSPPEPCRNISLYSFAT